MRSFTLNFWPGLFLAAVLRVGPGLQYSYTRWYTVAISNMASLAVLV